MRTAFQAFQPRLQGSPQHAPIAVQVQPLSAAFPEPQQALGPLLPHCLEPLCSHSCSQKLVPFQEPVLSWALCPLPPVQAWHSRATDGSGANTAEVPFR